MKKAMFCFVLLVAAMSAMAQEAADGMYVYAGVSGLGPNDYVADVSAYIGDECVATSKQMTALADGKEIPYYVLYIRAKEENIGKEVTFRINLRSFEYEITSLTGIYKNNAAQRTTYKTVTYDGPETSYGTLSSLVNLIYEAPQFNLPSSAIDIYEGETMVLTEQFDIDGSVPCSLTFSYDSDAIQIYRSEADGAWTLAGITTTSSPVEVTIAGNRVDYGSLWVNVNVVPVHVDSISASERMEFPTVLKIGYEYPLDMGYVTFHPDGVTNRNLVWSSSDESIVKIGSSSNYSESGGLTPILIPQAAGTATITATSEDNRSATVVFPVTVVQPVTKLTGVNGEAWRGDTINLYDYFIIEPSNATDKQLTFRLSGNSPMLPTVAKDGTVVFDAGCKTGTYTVNAVCEDLPNDPVRAMLTLKAHVESIELALTEPLYLPVGDTVTLETLETITGEMTPEDATDPSYTWTTAQSDIVELIPQDDMTAVKGLKAGTAELVITSVDNPAAKDTIEVTVFTPVQSAVFILKGSAITEYMLPVGESIDLDDMLAITPDDPSFIVKYELIRADRLATLEGSVLTAEARGGYLVRAHVYDAAGGEAFTDLWVQNYIPVTGVDAKNPIQTIYTDGAIDLSYSVSPSDADNLRVTMECSDPSVATIQEFDGGIFRATILTTGSISIVITTDDGGYTDTIHVTIQNRIKALTFPENETEDHDYAVAIGREAVTIPFTVLPADAVYDPAKIIVVTGSDNLSEIPDGWTAVDVDIDDDSKTLQVEGMLAGEHWLEFRYPDVNNRAIPIGALRVSVSESLELADGWNWRTMPSSGQMPDMEEFTDVFGAGLLEVRGQNEVAAKDPVYGFFGTLGMLVSNTCYKFYYDSPSGDGVSVPFSDIFGDIVSMGDEVQVYPGWNWVAYPYPYDYAFSEFVDVASWLLAEDSRIVAQDGTFAIAGATGFSGTLRTLQAGKGLMIYNSDTESAVLSWPAMMELNGGEQPTAVTSTAARRGAGTDSPFAFDCHRYADVMTIVATASGLDDASHCTIGAFVGDECRGIGTYADGRFFIGVNGEPRDIVTFRAYDSAADEWYNIAETLTFTHMAGTLGAPICFGATKGTTAIDGIGSEAGAGTIYDLQGRRVSDARNGLYIMGGKKVLMK